MGTGNQEGGGMTRQEIEERARNLMSEEDIARYDDDNEVWVVERHLTALALATLEEAARAVCFDCRHGVVLHANKEGRMAHWIHEDEEGDPCPCYSAEIHDLIAALKPREGA